MLSIYLLWWPAALPCVKQPDVTSLSSNKEFHFISLCIIYYLLTCFFWFHWLHLQICTLTLHNKKLELKGSDWRREQWAWACIRQHRLGFWFPILPLPVYIVKISQKQGWKWELSQSVELWLLMLAAAAIIPSFTNSHSINRREAVSLVNCWSVPAFSGRGIIEQWSVTQIQLKT